MLNPELKKELMLKLQEVIKEIKTECDNDSEFYDHLEQVDILSSIEELQSLNGINKLIEKYDKAINVKSNEKYEKYNKVIKSLMDKDRYSTYDEVLDNYDNDLDKAINEIKLCLSEIINLDECEDEDLPFYQEQLNLINELIVLGYDTYYYPIYINDEVHLKNGDIAKVSGINESGNLIASNEAGFEYDLYPGSVIKK